MDVYAMKTRRLQGAAIRRHKADQRNAMKRLRQAVHAAGGTIKADANVESIDITATAPDGKVWKESSTHDVSDNGRSGAGAREIIASRLLADVAAGVVDCTDEDCTICNEE